MHHSVDLMPGDLRNMEHFSAPLHQQAPVCSVGSASRAGAGQPLSSEHSLLAIVVSETSQKNNKGKKVGHLYVSFSATWVLFKEKISIYHSMH